jgi:hypothetical protein
VQLYETGGLGAYPNFQSFWESEARNQLFNVLKTVVIEPIGLVPTDCTVAIIKFILRTACVLEDMVIRDLRVILMMYAMRTPSMLQYVSRTDKDMKFMKETMVTVLEVLGLSRLSKKATICFEESDIIDRIEQSISPASPT